MRAALLDNGSLELMDVPIPDPGPDEALVRLTAAGVCHSDLHLVKGDWPALTPPSMPLGHEGIGIVEAVGAGAERYVQVGDRVILGLGGMGGGYWCGACEFCLAGKPRLCAEARGAFGTFAEYIRIWTRALVKLPDSIGDDEVSLACGGLTAYSAVKKLQQFGVLPGKPIAIVGAAGGLGHYGVQIGNAFGYKVIGVDVGEERVEFVRSLGAAAAFDVSEAAERVREDYDGVRASIVFAARVAGFELGFQLLRRGGVFVSVGMPAASEGSFGIGPLDLLWKDATVISSAVGTVQEMRELVDLAADGKVRTHIGRRGQLDDLPAIFEELERGGYAGRAILTI
jgi:alcohol dehydrogenase, propanol-preferring